MLFFIFLCQGLCLIVMRHSGLRHKAALCMRWGIMGGEKWAGTAGAHHRNLTANLANFFQLRHMHARVNIPTEKSEKLIMLKHVHVHVFSCIFAGDSNYQYAES